MPERAGEGPYSAVQGLLSIDSDISITCFQVKRVPSRMV